MASWGEIAVGEARHTASYPSKSAICGLLGAALGIDRDDEPVNCALSGGYHQSVKMLRTGHLLKDYHTAQAPDSVGKFRYRTRRDELIVGKDRLGTVLSSRDYRTDALAIVAIRALETAPFPLEELRVALQRPKYHLYLGRKSCPLAAPLNPEIKQAEGFREALDGYGAGELLAEPLGDWASDSRWLPSDAVIHYYWEGSMEAFAANDSHFSIDQVQQLVRHDMPLSRRRWQFQPRHEYLWLDGGRNL